MQLTFSCRLIEIKEFKRISRIKTMQLTFSWQTNDLTFYVSPHLQISSTVNRLCVKPVHISPIPWKFWNQRNIYVLLTRESAKLHNSVLLRKILFSFTSSFLKISWNLQGIRGLLFWNSAKLIEMCLDQVLHRAN